MARRRKRRGHFCWSCRSYLPNERFSGGGHARHLCKRCSRLGQAELRYRQATLDLDRLLDRGGGRIRKRDREAFSRFLSHSDTRVREYARKISEYLEREQQAFLDALEADELACERMAEIDELSYESREVQDDATALSDDEIPF